MNKVEVLGEGDAVKYYVDNNIIVGNCLSDSHKPCLKVNECAECGFFKPRRSKT